MSRSCRRCREELSRLPPGTELPEALAAHLRACPECRSWQEQDAGAWTALGALAQPVPPAGLVARIVEAGSRARGRGRVGPAFKLAAAAAALAGALAGAWLGSGLFGSTEIEPARAPEEVFADLFDAAPERALDLPLLEDAASGRGP